MIRPNTTEIFGEMEAMASVADDANSPEAGTQLYLACFSGISAYEGIALACQFHGV